MEELAELINAAEHGIVEAMYELGMMYYAGVDVAENEIRALRWMKKAADNGDKFAGEVYKQWNSDRQEKYLVNMLGEDYIAKYGKAVVFDRCPKPLPIDNWVHIAAYCCFSSIEYARLNPDITSNKYLGSYIDDSDWLCKIQDKVGKKLRLCVYSPFYCKISETFSVEYDRDHFITCQLLGINRYKNTYADISAKVLSEGDSLSFLKPVSDNKKAQLESEKRYDYQLEKSCDDIRFGFAIKYCRHGHWLCVNKCDEYSCYNEYIYTDDSGIDHLLQIRHQEDQAHYSWFGDKILGFHKYCPIKIEETTT